MAGEIAEVALRVDADSPSFAIPDEQIQAASARFLPRFSGMANMGGAGITFHRDSALLIISKLGIMLRGTSEVPEVGIAIPEYVGLFSDALKFVIEAWGSDFKCRAMSLESWISLPAETVGFVPLIASVSEAMSGLVPIADKPRDIGARAKFPSGEKSEITVTLDSCLPDKNGLLKVHFEHETTEEFVLSGAEELLTRSVSALRPWLDYCIDRGSR